MGGGINYPNIEARLKSFRLFWFVKREQHRLKLERHIWHASFDHYIGLAQVDLHEIYQLVPSFYLAVSKAEQESPTVLRSPNYGPSKSRIGPLLN